MTSSTDLLASPGSANMGVEFFIDTIDRGKDGALRYIGYINSGGSVSLGEVFVEAYVIPRSIDDVRMMRPLAAPVNRRRVSLTLTHIEVMRQSIQLLGQGITAIVGLSGEGLDLLCEGDRLNTRPGASEDWNRHED
ncbi:hypothetical protein [uncultured Stenotrophomonas sp.]|uniref:hypothetical protein n=1 Tax=uncultured Stenotrophomonas sp. TaxID=165438 RepID=UPI0028E4BF2B|nr:hypothetical protein [uncultured Stenotrophomonas sp.]